MKKITAFTYWLQLPFHNLKDIIEYRYGIFYRWHLIPLNTQNIKMGNAIIQNQDCI